MSLLLKHDSLAPAWTSADDEDRSGMELCNRPETRWTGVRVRRAAAAAAIAACLAWHGTAFAQEDANDPLEPFNRAVFEFNVVIDGMFLKPMAIMYRMVVPELVREGISNFLHNLSTPVILVNDILQGEKERAGVTFARFLLNTTAGFAGFVDIATDRGYPRHSEDFGQTLATYGVGEGPYLMLPILGPSNPRDAVGLAADTAAHPIGLFGFYGTELPLEVTATHTGMTVVDKREENIETLDELEEGSIDFYATLRTVYRQHRDSEIRNGALPPDDELYEDIFDEEETFDEEPTLDDNS